MDINEKALLYRAQTGDRQAAGRLYENYYQDIYSYVFYKVTEKETVINLTAEVFVRMIQQLPSYFNQQKPFIHWLYQLAQELINEHHQISKKHQPLPKKNVERVENSDNGQRNDMYTAGVDCFRRAIRHLNEPQQTVIIHRFVEGRSLEDVADLMNQNKQKLQSLQVKALRSLEKALHKENCL